MPLLYANEMNHFADAENHFKMYIFLITQQLDR